MLTTTELRRAWAPPCTGPFVRVPLYGAGAVSVRPAILDAVEALNAALVTWNYRTRQKDTGAYNCRPITGGTLYSLHAYGIAVDINWTSNPYGPTLVTDMPGGMIAAIKAIRTNNGKQVWRWGGDYSGNRDAMHFEVVCTPADIATGINPATIPGTKPGPNPFPPTTPPPLPPITPSQEDDMLVLAQVPGRPEVWITDGVTKSLVVNETQLGGHKIVMGQRGVPNDVLQVGAEWLDPIPRNRSDAEWLNYAKAIVDSVVNSLPAGAPGSPGVDNAAIAAAVAAEFSKRLAA